MRQQFATRIQQVDRRLDLKAALDQADGFLEDHWGGGKRWCDAKRVLSGLRTWLQTRKLPLELREKDIVDAMAQVPADVRRVLGEMRRLVRPKKGPVRARAPQ